MELNLSQEAYIVNAYQHIVDNMQMEMTTNVENDADDIISDPEPDCSEAPMLADHAGDGDSMSEDGSG